MSVTLENISVSKFTSNKAAGSKSGAEYFSLVGSIQHRIQQITVHLAEDCIRRVTVKKFDQTCIVVGGSNGIKSHIDWTFEPDEKFTKIQLFSRGGKFAGMEISTNLQEKLKILSQGTGPLGTLEVEKGSGKCVGMFGHGGAYVSSLGFAILKE